MDHAQVKIAKTIMVDEDIAPLIKWINSFEGVYTFSSCVGESDMVSYVSFFVVQSIDGSFGWEKLKNHILANDVDMDESWDHGMWGRCILKFANREAIMQFQESVKNMKV